MAVDKKLFLLDGMNLIYRAYWGLQGRPMVTRSGIHTSAIFGYTNMLLEILNTHNPSHLAVVFDTPEPTARHRLFPQYKAQREAMPEDLSAALPHVFRLTEACNVRVLRYPGYEADDVIGTLTRQADADGFQTYMVTADKDYAQLVTATTVMYKPGMRGSGAEILGVSEVLEKWNVDTVDQVRDILGLWGDSSDNIPGIPGIGEKTAQKLIRQFGSIEGVIERIDELKGKQKERIEQYGEQGLLSKRLVTIDCDVPVDVELDELAWAEWDAERVHALFVEFEFRALERRHFGDAPIPSASSPATSASQPDLFDYGEGGESTAAGTTPTLRTIDSVSPTYRTVDTEAEIVDLLAKLNRQSSFCFDIETTSRDTKIAEIVGIAFSWTERDAYFVVFPQDMNESVRLLERFRPHFEGSDVVKVGHNLHYDLSVLRWHGVVSAGPIFDTMLAHYIIDPEGRHGLDRVAEALLGYRMISYKEAVGDRANLREVAVDVVTRYACEDADICWQLAAVLEPLLKEKNGEEVLRRVDAPLPAVLVDMEHAGIRLDVDALALYGSELRADVDRLHGRINDAAGIEFNLDSPKQLGDVLFGHLKLDPKAKRTRKTGQFATSEDVLQRLAGKHQIIRDILEYRTCRKLLSTYVDTLPSAVCTKTGRVHTTYSQAVTATGRLQSNSPNLQNIPIRTARGREIRKAFIPRNDDYRLLSADYSQIELRVIASLSKDEAMIDAFHQSVDIHQTTAARIFGVELDQVEPEMRRRAKMVNFGIIYGISSFGLANRLGIRRGEAGDIIAQYFAQYPGVRDYLDRTLEKCRETGYVETLTGRRRYLRDINSRNSVVRAAAERNAINAPVQGTAADMIKLAMATIHRRLRDGSYRTRMVLQVHDELVFDLCREERQEVVPIIVDAMKTALPLSVPVVVDTGIGRNWLEAH